MYVYMYIYFEYICMYICFEYICMYICRYILKIYVSTWLEKTTAIRRIAVRETGVSRQSCVPS